MFELRKNKRALKILLHHMFTGRNAVPYLIAGLFIGEGRFLDLLDLPPWTFWVIFAAAGLAIVFYLLRYIRCRTAGNFSGGSAWLPIGFSVSGILSSIVLLEASAVLAVSYFVAGIILLIIQLIIEWKKCKG